MSFPAIVVEWGRTLFVVPAPGFHDHVRGRFRNVSIEMWVNWQDHRVGMAEVL